MSIARTTAIFRWAITLARALEPETQREEVDRTALAVLRDGDVRHARTDYGIPEGYCVMSTRPSIEAPDPLQRLTPEKVARLRETAQSLLDDHAKESQAPEPAKAAEAPAKSRSFAVLIPPWTLRSRRQGCHSPPTPKPRPWPNGSRPTLRILPQRIFSHCGARAPRRR